MPIASAEAKGGKVIAYDANGIQICVHPGTLHAHSPDRVAVRNGDILTVYNGDGQMLGNTTVALWAAGIKL